MLAAEKYRDINTIMPVIPIAPFTGAAQAICLACPQVLSKVGCRLVLCDIQGDKVVAAAEALGNGRLGTNCTC